MTTARFSLRLEPELKEWLEDEAKRQDRSAGNVAIQAIEALKSSKEARRKMLREAVRKADEGVFISGEAVTDWFLALDTENEKPFPKPDIFLKSERK